MLHDADDGAALESRGQSERPGRHGQNGDDQGPWQIARVLRDRDQLLGGARLQVHGPHVLWTGPGDTLHAAFTKCSPRAVLAC